MIAGTEAGFFVIENDSLSTALLIQNETFLAFQQNMFKLLFGIIRNAIVKKNN